MIDPKLQAALKEARGKIDDWFLLRNLDFRLKLLQEARELRIPTVSDDTLRQRIDALLEERFRLTESLKPAQNPEIGPKP